MNHLEGAAKGEGHWGIKDVLQNGNIVEEEETDQQQQINNNWKPTL